MTKYLIRNKANCYILVWRAGSAPAPKRPRRCRDETNTRSQEFRWRGWGRVYQDAAEGQWAGSGWREDSQPTRCRCTAANALLISATEKIPPHPASSSRPHTHLCQPARAPTPTPDRCFRPEVRIEMRFIFGGTLNPRCKQVARSPSFYY